MRFQPEQPNRLFRNDAQTAIRANQRDQNMGVPLNNERRTSEFSANQQVKPQGKVLPWLMTMPSPNEAMNIGRRPDEKRAAESNSAPEGRSGATQLMPIPDGPFRGGSSVSDEGRDATDFFRARRPCPATTLATRDPAETYIALKRPLRTAEHEGRKSHATPESSAENLRESSGACATEITPPPGLQLNQEITNIGLHPAETYVAPEADVAISAEHERWNSLAAPECASEKSEGVSDGTNEWGLSPRANYLMPDDEIASVAQANQLERDWIRVVSDVPSADSFQGGVAEFKQSDLATTGQQNRHPHHLGRQHFYSIGPVHLDLGCEALPRLTAWSRDGVPCCER